jgi:CheY-like chemotaxis protein
MKRILIVDDDVRLLDTTRKILEPTGEYEVMTEDSGQRAVAAAATFKPDMAILDVMMPGMEGGEVACALRSHPATQNLPVLFLTSLITRGEQTRGKQRLTRDVYLAKPVEPEELCRRVAELLGE